MLRKRVCSGADRRYLHGEEAIMRIAVPLREGLVKFAGMGQSGGEFRFRGRVADVL